MESPQILDNKEPLEPRVGSRTSISFGRLAVSTVTVIPYIEGSPNTIILGKGPLYEGFSFPSIITPQVPEFKLQAVSAQLLNHFYEIMSHACGPMNPMGVAYDPERDVRGIDSISKTLRSHVQSTIGKLSADTFTLQLSYPDTVFYLPLHREALELAHKTPDFKIINSHSHPPDQLPGSQELFLRWHEFILDHDRVRAHGEKKRSVPLCALKDFKREIAAFRDPTRSLSVHTLFDWSADSHMHLFSRGLISRTAHLECLSRYEEQIQAIEKRIGSNINVVTVKEIATSSHDIKNGIKDVIELLREFDFRSDPIKERYKEIIGKLLSLRRKVCEKERAIRHSYRERYRSDRENLRDEMLLALAEEKDKRVGAENAISQIFGRARYEKLPWPEGGLGYAPSPVRVLNQLVSELHKHSLLREKSVIFDIGSGEGQTALVLNLLTGKEVLGLEYQQKYVDFSNQLAHEIGASSVNFVQGDARYYHFSEGDIFYLFNPFGNRETERLVFQRLKEASETRPIVVVCFHGPSLRDISWLKTVSETGPLTIAVSK